MIAALRLLFMVVVVRPLVLLVLGLNVRNRERLPSHGPAIIAANHNSHLDTFVLMSLFPLAMLNRLRPVAAADYFLSNKVLAWFTLNIIHMIPIERGKANRARARQGGDPLEECSAALRAGEILLVFPEGSRGENEQLTRFKGGIARLKEEHPEVPVYPVYMQGLGRVLPKGEVALVPAIVDVFVGDPLAWTGTRSAFTEALEQAVSTMAAAAPRRSWH
ncbi:MAG TPA: lysophospholipid acyltransferase family protein [Dongiaceae bacterium]|jgi:1-acyl-sn-glycerol-3-phosphate acyltransferase